jgi:hypothetical protein
MVKVYVPAGVRPEGPTVQEGTVNPVLPISHRKSSAILLVRSKSECWFWIAKSLGERTMRKVFLGVSLAVIIVLSVLAQAQKYGGQRFGSVANGSKLYPVAATAPAVLPSGGSIATEPNLKIAFIGDAGHGSNQQAVLSLIKSEGAQAVLHQGDLDHDDDPVAFWASVDRVLGPEFPYFVSVGNHDIEYWPTTVKPSYAQLLKDRMARIGVTPDGPDLNDEMYSIEFKGLKVVFVGQEKMGDQIYTPYVQSQLNGDNHIWKICSWHRDMEEMQVGGKADDMGWGVYEACKNQGAIIATAHEHSYERTKTLISIQNQMLDPESPDPNHLTVAPGRTFVFVSGLGGVSIRDQKRCLPTTPPYGCKGEWAKIYTSSQQAQFGALFITFNVNGNPNKARGYFKNINGQIVDEFDVTKYSTRALPLPAAHGSR